jgi:translation elongation factor EF-Tu-like GTPase
MRRRANALLKMYIPKDIETEMTFLKTEEGGRKTPARSGYHLQFYYDGHDWDAIPTYINAEFVYPGQTVRAYLAFLSPEHQLGKVHPGMEFLIREGAGTVAKGLVVKIIDLERSAQRAKK